MKRFGVCLLLLSAVLCGAQVKKGASVYIEPMGGYESYLSAAFLKKQVPLVIVTDKSKAAYIVRGTVNQSVAGAPTAVVSNTSNANTEGNDAFTEGMKLGARYGSSVGSVSSSILLVDPHTARILFAYSVEKSRKNLLQSTAEACAKHLKQFVDSSKP